MEPRQRTKINQKSIDPLGFRFKSGQTPWKLRARHRETHSENRRWVENRNQQNRHHSKENNQKPSDWSHHKLKATNNHRIEAAMAPSSQNAIQIGKPSIEAEARRLENPMENPIEKPPWIEIAVNREHNTATAWTPSEKETK